MVCPTISGMIIDALDHVLITDFLFVELALSTFAINLLNTYGPFLTDLAISNDCLLLRLYFLISGGR